jgi:hypothetical protein
MSMSERLGSADRDARLGRHAVARAGADLLPALPRKGGAPRVAAETPELDDLEEPDPPADTRPLSPAIPIVRVRSGGALQRSVSGTHRQECLNPRESAGIQRHLRGLERWTPPTNVLQRLPGVSGVIDARAFVTVLDEIGLDGPALVEPFNAEVRALAPEERVAAVAASLESVWP